jgi:hypothetical protein
VDKTAIKNFSIWARKKAIADVSNKAAYFGITAKEIKSPLPQSTPDLQFIDIGAPTPTKVIGKEIEQRNALLARIKAKEAVSGYKTAYNSVMEEVAYTWFNRLIAIRFMEVNDYLPSHTRVLSSEDPKKLEPDFVTNPFETDLEFTKEEQTLIHKYKEENKLGMLFRMLFIKQCNKLNEILPELFEKTNDYSELLLNISFTDQEGLVYHLTHDISEDDFNVEKEGQIEIIGWIYQFYNTELKAKADAEVKEGIKITKRNLPEKTQIFTPDWIVRYMVENSLGRLWIEGHPNNDLKDGWEYYIDEAEQDPNVAKKLAKNREEYKSLKPENIKVIDPCMGSGHILVCFFEVLMQIYISVGWNRREAAHSILANNLYGLDIDERASQLAYFAVMMKARQYDPRILTLKIQPNVYSIRESNSVDPFLIEYFENGNTNLKYCIETIVREMHDAKEYGSMLNITKVDFTALYIRFAEIKNDLSLMQSQALNELMPIVKCADVMAHKYDVVVTNPPYLGLRSMGDKTLSYLQHEYPDSKNDLFSVFIDKSINFTRPFGKTSLVTSESWLSLSSFEKIRMKILHASTICNMAHLGTGAFDAGFGTVAFVITNGYLQNYKSTYLRLTDCETDFDKETALTLRNAECLYISNQSDFAYIPGSPIAYWVSQRLFNTFSKYKQLGEIAEPRQGLTTCDNDRFMRFWHEVKYQNISFYCTSPEESEKLPHKWFPYIKGGEPRKWYGNNEYVVNWKHNGNEIKTFVASKYVSYSRTVKNIPYYFKKGLTWSAIAKKYAVRAYNTGFIFADKGQAIFTNEKNYYYLCGLMNSKFVTSILEILSPTLDFNCGYIKKVPIAFESVKQTDVGKLVQANIHIAKTDWDSFECSWDFKTHPLITHKSDGWIETSFRNWEEFAERQFYQLKANEEELNRIFIDIYGLQDELTPDVEEKDVTVRKADLGRDVRSFISYSVGCILGRYSLDVEGLAYAGGNWDQSRYKTYVPDADNCIPITDEEYFDDDVVSRFVDFVKTVYGKDTLGKNLEFIAEALGNRGDTPLKTIRNYFINEFYKDHVKIYQKRPIYWLFESGKENGFKALIYMHRYNADTIGNMRIEYIHRLQAKYESQLSFEQHLIDTSQNQREKSAAMKQKEKLIRQIKELRDYDVKIAHLANCRIEIDLDDGVKVNYEKVQTGKDGKMLEVLGKI